MSFLFNLPCCADGLRVRQAPTVSLPPELWFRICDYLTRLDHLSLSTLNQWFRAFARPLIFRDWKVRRTRWSIKGLHHLYHHNLLHFVRSLRITRFRVLLFDWSKLELPGAIYDRLVGFYLLRMPNLETIDFCYDGVSPSPSLFRYIARKSSIRRLGLRDLSIVPLNFWNEVEKLRGSGTMSISGYCNSHPGGTRPFLVTSVNLQSNSSTQFFIAYPSPWLTCLSVNLSVVGSLGNWSLLKDLLKASPYLTDLTVHSPGAVPCPDRLLEPALVPRLQQISLESFDLMVQLKEGRPVRSISIYSPFQSKIGGRMVRFNERVETLNLVLDEAHLHGAAEVIAQSTGVRSLGLSIILSPYSVCCLCRVTSLTLTEPHEGAAWIEYQDTPKNVANLDHPSPIGHSFYLQARINRRDRPE